jgi:hypothetical protein
MLIPANFFGSTPSLRPTYVNEDTGDFNPERFFAGKAPWKKSTPSKSPFCKPLVITDWTAPFWLTEKINAVIALIHQLQERGFDVYLWDAIEKKVNLIFDPDVLFFKESPLNKIRPFDREELLQIASDKLSLHPDNIMLIDDYWMDIALKNTDETTPRELSVYHFSQLRTLDQDILLKALKTAKIPVQVIADNYMGGNDTPKLVTSLLNKLDIDPKHVTKNLYAFSLSLDALAPGRLNEVIIALSDVAIVETTSNLSQKQLDLVFTHAKKMKSFAPGIQVEPPDDDLITTLTFDYAPESMPCLQRFVLPANIYAFSEGELVKLLKAAPTLSILECNSEKQVETCFMKELSDSIFPHLKQLDSSYTINEPEDLRILARVFPSLVTYQLDVSLPLDELEVDEEELQYLTPEADEADEADEENQSLTDDSRSDHTNLLAYNPPALGDTSLLSLKELKIADMPFQYLDGICTLLNLTKNLDKLSMYWRPRIPVIENRLAPLVYLRELQIDLSSDEDNEHNLVSTDEFWQFIKACPALSLLHIHGSRPLERHDGCTDLPRLEELEHLKMSDINFTKSGNMLELFLPLQNAAHLKQISFNNCELDKYRLGSLADVEEISITYCKVAPAFLKEIATKATKLKRLNLTGSLYPLYRDWHELRLAAVSLPEVVVVISGAEYNKKYQIDRIIEHATIEHDNSADEPESSDDEPESSDDEPESSDDELDSFDDEPHNSLSMLDFKPPCNKPFVFGNKNKTKSQEMIIDKLCHYLMDYLPAFPIDKPSAVQSMQKGICEALSYFFNFLPNLITFQQFLNDVLAWNGREVPAYLLQQHFATLLEFVKKYYLLPRTEPIKCKFVDTERYFKFLKGQFKTDQAWMNLGDLFPTQSIEIHKFILCNPWHAISLVQINHSTWVVYDPNYTKGPQKFEVTSEENQKALFNAIRYALGDLLLIESSSELPLNLVQPLHIADINNFIKEGGLLAIFDAANQDAMIDMLLKCPDFAKKIDSAALSGILLRDIEEGFPGWYLGILYSGSSKVPVITWALLEEFILKNPHDFIAQLTDSLALLEPVETQMTMQKVKETLSATSPAVFALYKKIAEAAKFETKLEKSNKPSPPKNTTHVDSAEMDVCSDEPALELAEFCAAYVNQGVKKQLITLNSSKSTMGLQYAMQQYCLHQGIPVFVANSPDDLICSAPFVRANGNRGIVTKGPGGPLHEFLTKNARKPAVLLMNFDQIDDVVQCNSILDDENPHADGTPIPDLLVIIGMMNISNPNCYLGDDLTGRFSNDDYECPISTAQLEAAIPPLSITFSDNPISAKAINLFNEEDWKQRLLGRWVLNNGELVFQEGELVKALEQGNILEIGCGLWSDPEFIDFWHQAFLNKSIPYALGTIEIPKDLQLICSNHYNWELLNQKVVFLAEPFDDITQVINPYNFNTYFNRYEVDNASHTLIHSDGLVKTFADKDMHVTFTRSISDDNWAMLLSECVRWKVRLIPHCAPGVTLPEAIALLMAQAMEVDQIKFEVVDPFVKTQVITSTDVDTTVESFCEKDNWLVIDVSDCEPSDLLKRIKGVLDPDSLKFEFVEEESLLLRALIKEAPVMLKGSFSDELVDCLAPLLIARAREENPPGQLVLISEDEKTARFSFHPVSHHDVLVEEKKKFLGLSHDSLAAFFESESLSKLKARQRYITMTDDTHSDNAWLGLYHLPPKKPAVEEDSMLDAVQIFMDRRRAQLEQVLTISPFVYISGPSGVGKSTFIENDFATANDRLYLTEANLVAWASDITPDTRKILFLDEANFKDKWSMFEGLFNRPPGIIINGIDYPLTPEHKVIFAGNPITYGSGRTAAKFFQRHGSCVVFDPIPPAVIASKIIMPVLSKAHWSEKAISDSCRVILEVYGYLCERSNTEILISPRELQMMALQASVLANQLRVDLLLATHDMAWRIGRNCLPNKNDIEFNERFKPKELIKYALHESVDGYFITPSREPLWQQLHEHLSLRELRCSGQLSENDAQRYGGLGGIIVEGEPGAGKSRLVEAALKSRGYQQRLWNNTDVIEGGDYYYKMPASMPIDEKKALLLRAFHEGAVVFCDEINSGSTLLMEDFLNDLLTGKTPDEKKPPHKPGFTIFGTQNPVIMGGNRIEASTALLRRCQQVILPGYPSEEIASILSHQFGQEHRELIETIVYAFETATKNSKIKPPTFRHLLKLIKAEISLTVSANDGMEVSVQSDLPNAHGFFSETSAPKSSARTWSMRDDEPVDEPQQRPRCS